MSNHFYCIYVFVLVIYLLQTGYKARGQDRWSLLTSCNSCPSYNAVTYGGGQWVIVGDYGRILTSTDGLTWVNQNANTTENLSDVVYAADRWLCVGSNGITLSSPDGVNWTTHTTDPANSFYGVSYGNGLWIAVGHTNNVRVGYGIVFTSTDGITWMDQPALHLSAYFNKIRYLNNTWYIVGGNGLILTSSNGTDWITRNSNTINSLNAIAYGGGQFIVCGNDGNVVRSSDGVNWSVQRASDTPINDISYGNGHWVIVSNLSFNWPVLYTSSDNGLNWNRVTSLATNNLHGVHYNNGRWIAVGGAYTILTSPDVSNPLPITLQYFNGRITSEGMLLAWATSHESNSDHFRVERSSNAINFEAIGSIASYASNGNSSTPLSYSFTDTTPLSGTNYYHLMQVDRDGKQSTSSIIALSREYVTQAFYPNPVPTSGEILFEPAIRCEQYQLIDMQGKILQQSQQPSLLNSLSMRGLPAGQCILKVQSNGQSFNYRLLIKP